MEWSEANLLKLIDVYRRKDILWDPRHKDHFKKTLKTDAWKEEEMEVPSEICKKKVISLLSSYRREKCKVKNSQSTGKGRDEIYVSRWFAYDAFKFLEDRDEPRKGLTTKADDILRNEGDAETLDNPPEKSQTETTAPSSSQRPTKRAKVAIPSMMSSAFNILSDAAKKMDNQPTKPNEIDSFFTYVAAKVNKYSPAVQNSVQHAVFDILMKADTGFYNWAAPNLQQSNYWQHRPENATTHSQQYDLQPLNPIQPPVPIPSPSASFSPTSNQPSPAASVISEHFSDFV